MFALNLHALTRSPGFGVPTVRVHIVLRVRFIDNETHQFTLAEQASIVGVARDAEDIVGAVIQLGDPLHLWVEGSKQVLQTGDNAFTESTDLLRWWVDPQRGVTQVAQAHLVQAFAHEAFHATRFRRLAGEASSRDLIGVAIGEGLATAFARDTTGATDPWAVYDTSIIHGWLEDLLTDSAHEVELGEWKFRHPDGREWVAFRVGTWIVDQFMALTGQSAAELMWTPTSDIAKVALPGYMAGRFPR